MIDYVYYIRWEARSGATTKTGEGEQQEREIGREEATREEEREDVGEENQRCTMHD